MYHVRIRIFDKTISMKSQNFEDLADSVLIGFDLQSHSLKAVKGVEVRSFRLSPWVAAKLEAFEDYLRVHEREEVPVKTLAKEYLEKAFPELHEEMRPVWESVLTQGLVPREFTVEVVGPEIMAEVKEYFGNAACA
nr:hypothetical protein BdHM001_35170 [Bdellovibrio sp. HM001]